MLDDRVDVLLAISEIDRGCNFATGDVTHDYSTSESASVQRECGSKSPRQQVVRELPRRGSTRLESRRRWNFESARQEKKNIWARWQTAERLGWKRDYSGGNRRKKAWLKGVKIRIRVEELGEFPLSEALNEMFHWVLAFVSGIFVWGSFYDKKFVEFGMLEIVIAIWKINVVVKFIRSELEIFSEYSGHSWSFHGVSKFIQIGPLEFRISQHSWTS